VAHKCDFYRLGVDGKAKAMVAVVAVKPELIVDDLDEHEPRRLTAAPLFAVTP